MGLENETSQHDLGHFKIGDHTGTDGTDGCEVGVRPPDHALGIGSNGNNDPPRLLLPLALLYNANNNSK